MSKIQYIVLLVIATIWMASSILFGLLAYQHRQHSAASGCKTNTAIVGFLTDSIASTTFKQALADPSYTADYTRLVSLIGEIREASPCEIKYVTPPNILR